MKNNNIEEKSELSFLNKSNSFGFGLALLLYALDSITLGNIHYPSIIANHLNVPVSWE